MGGQSLQILLGHSDWVQGCAAFPATTGVTDPYGTSDEDESLWDGPPAHRPQESARCDNSLQETVITVSSDSKAIVWDATSGAKLQTLVGHSNLLHACAVFPSGGKVVTVSGDETGIIWDVRTAVNLQ